MQDLNNGIHESMSNDFGGTQDSGLRETAKKWAGHCCENLDGTLLDKGLEVSKSIIKFLNEREQGNG